MLLQPGAGVQSGVTVCINIRVRVNVGVSIMAWDEVRI